MFSTPYVVGNKTKKAENFNRFLSNTSQMTYTYREGMGFIWVFLGILALAWVVFKKFYDECNVINRRIFNRKHNIKEPDNDGF